MTISLDPELQLSFDASALERCYLAADVLQEVCSAPTMEYALLGLSTRSNPFHVVATPLLCGQRVSASTVEQPGYEVLRMRREIDALSKRIGQRLLPIAFIHRHPGACDASDTDDAFLRNVFIDHVATVVSFEEVRRVEAGALPFASPCKCPGMQRQTRDLPVEIAVEYGVAFSLIVNQEREHRLYCLRKTSCPFCGRDEVAYAPARLAPDSQRGTSSLDRAFLRWRLEKEIREKVRFVSESAREVS